MRYFIIKIIIFFVLSDKSFSLSPLVRRLGYKKDYSFEVNNSVEYIFQFEADLYSLEKPIIFPTRITIESYVANLSAPLMVVARQANDIISWQLPLIVESESEDQYFQKTARTLCYNFLKKQQYLLSKKYNDDRPFVTVSTASNKNVTFSVTADFQEDFYILPSKFYNFSITPSEPRYYYYNFTTNSTLDSSTSNYDTVILEVTSEDSVCMTVSIQNVSCPVFDLNQVITFRGFYETVNKKGGITIPKYKFPNGFYIVFVAKGDDYDCTNNINESSKNRTSKISLIINPSITYDDYVYAVACTLGAIGVFYLVFITLYFGLCNRHDPREMGYVCDDIIPSTPNINVSSCNLDNISNESEYDTLAEEEETDFILSKPNLYLIDLARKNPRILSQKSYLYLYNVLTMAIFYGMPVIQLVITYQNILNKTGQQDLCYYNFLCAHPLGWISDFNHLFSNIAYVMFGVLFIIITYRREVQHKDEQFERSYGIPQHYGMFYAMGCALIMEGVLSGSYHVCPNSANFQFDSSFMYVMCVLCIVKLYQNRHPDINAKAYSTFGVLAVAIFLSMVGIFEGTINFYVIFAIIYLLTSLYLSIKIYYLGRWKLDKTIFKRIYNSFRQNYSLGVIYVVKPKYKSRFVLLIFVTLCNCTLAFLGVYFHKKGFGLYVLGIFMANTLLYFVFYIIMKHIHKERVNLFTWIFLALSLMCASSAMYFFLHKIISWTETPAESRHFNQECKLLRFYDSHDIWHFLSATGMFFMFMVLLTLDDDLSHKHRSLIAVF